MPKKVPIDQLLQWAYRDELPKGYRDGSVIAAPQASPMFKYAALGGPVDNWSREPGFPVAMGTQPHPDAIALHNAVMAIEYDLGIAWPAAAPVLLGELACHVSADDLPIIRKIKEQPRGLVSLHARMGNRPPWHVDYSVTRIIGKERNSPLRKGRGRKHANLLGEWMLNPSAPVIVEARFEYLAWHWSLCQLARACHGASPKLSEHEPLPPEAPQLPWFDGEQGPTILSDSRWMTARELASGRSSSMSLLPLKPARPRALPQERQARGGPVYHIDMRRWQKGGA